MAISYNDWKKQYESLDAKWKAQYEALAKNSALWQQYMQQYKAWASTTIGGTPVWNSSTWSWTPTIWGTKVWTTQWTSWGSNGWSNWGSNNNTYTIGWTSVGNSSTSNNWGNFTIWWTQVGNNQTEWSTPVSNWTPVWWYTTPQGNNGSVLQDANTVDVSTWPKSIFDKPDKPVTNFSVLGINPQWEKTTQKWNWGTNRTNVTTPKNKGYTTPQQQQWDYQDNSQARMNQIADNLDKYTITNPELFNNYDGFYNFFIAWKGRSEDQKRFLDQYYADYKKNEKYNNMSPDEIWVGIANWTVPEDYLNYIKNKDPQRYNDIMLAKKDREDSIRNEWGLQTIVETMWDINSNTNNISWQKKEEIRMDEDDNWIDDRREHYATEEEQGYQKQIADLNARNLEIDNAIKNTYDELRDRYPWASKSTLMAMANDRNSDIMREKENNLVELTRLQGYVGYMQAERKEMNEAWDKSIAQLQKNLWMYYEYSPEGMKELANAQYEAAHPSLDKAENGTDTEKARALEAILQWYYDKYWDIIQRPIEQVIQDVIREAKASGKSLSDTLKDNFITPLRAKPQFDSYSNWGISPQVSFEKVWDNWYILTVNPDGTYSLESVNWWTSWSAAGNMFQYSNYTPITEEELDAWLQSFMEKHPLKSDWGQCGSFVNDYLESLWYDRLYTDPIDKKKAVTNSKVATVWAVAVMDSKKYPQYWHTAIVTDIQWDKVKILESNWNDDKKVHERWVNKSEILGYFDPSKAASNTSVNNQLNSKFSWPDWNPNGYFNSLAWDFKSYIKDGKLQLTKDQYASLKETYWINDQEFRQMAANYANSELKGNWGQQAANALNYAIKTYEYLYGKDYDWLWGNMWVFRMWGWFLPWTSTEKAKWEYESLMKRLSLKELFDAKALWATFWAMSDAEWSILENAATDLDWYHTNFKDNLEDLIESLYDATIDWNASLPKNYTGSSVETLINDRKSGWDTIWLTQEQIAANKQAQQTKFNAPKYATTNTDLWWEVDWDAIWES